MLCKANSIFSLLLGQESWLSLAITIFSNEHAMIVPTSRQDKSACKSAPSPSLAFAP